ncbi:MAG: S1C family serine protease [Acidimicrobiales bacterium]
MSDETHHPIENRPEASAGSTFEESPAPVAREIPSPSVVSSSADGPPLAAEESEHAPGDASPQGGGPRTLTVRRRSVIAAVAAGLVLASVAAGAIGFAVGRTNQSAVAIGPNSGSSGSGSITLPFGAIPGFGDPFGGSSSTAASIPSAVRAVSAALVDINTSYNYQQAAGAGTGIVLSSDGLVLTNNHVISGATSISAVDLGNGRTYSVKVLGYDRTADVALIQLEGAHGLTTATLSSSGSTPSVGSSVYALGNAGGAGGTPSMTAGSVVALDQSITASEDNGSSEQLSGLIETNANLYPGDSGGALTDASGTVVGMDTAASTAVSFNSSGQGYAIPISTALSIANAIEAHHGSATIHLGTTAFLGVEVSTTASGSGATIAGVIAGSPAASTSLTAGDVITTINGSPVTSPNSLANTIAGFHVGQKITLTWSQSSGTHSTASVVLVAGPPQ